MPLYMYQAAYTPESWAAQLKSPQNRAETVGRTLCEAAGGKLIGAWYCFGEYDLVLVADMPNAESMAAIALAVAAGGAIKASKTTALMSGDEGVAALRKAATVANAYKPAR
ncbi:MAG: GYD domain-containing protein [Acetobacteraceae bacterium]|nr:GYD domain-containing protein [Acetobacteraceae bacterium]